MGLAQKEHSVKITIPRMRIFETLMQEGAYALPNGVIPFPWKSEHVRHLPVVIRGTKHVELVPTTGNWRKKHGDYINVWRISDEGRKWYVNARMQISLSEARLIQDTDVRREGEKKFQDRERLRETQSRLVAENTSLLRNAEVIRAIHAGEVPEGFTEALQPGD